MHNPRARSTRYSISHSADPYELSLALVAYLHRVLLLVAPRAPRAELLSFAAALPLTAHAALRLLPVARVRLQLQARAHHRGSPVAHIVQLAAHLYTARRARLVVLAFEARVEVLADGGACLHCHAHRAAEPSWDGWRQHARHLAAYDSAAKVAGPGIKIRHGEL